jgi:hypothetical protein
MPWYPQPGSQRVGSDPPAAEIGGLAESSHAGVVGHGVEEAIVVLSKRRLELYGIAMPPLPRAMR